MKHRDESEFEQSCASWFTHSPKGWEVCSFRHCLEDVFNGLSVTQVDEAIDCVPVTRIETISSGLIDESRLGYIPRSEAREDRRLVNGDILFSNINSLNMIGNCAIYTGGREIFAGMNLLVLRPNTQSHSKWLYWLIKSSVLREVFESLAKPAINQASISQASIKSVKIPKPPLSEQRSIAAFLDAETSKIDALVAEQRRLIELLKEKRQAVISHAVTKGLNPHVKMKPSGIDWLGDVPEHWEVKRLKKLIKQGTSISYGIVQPGEPVEDGVPFVQTTNMTTGTFSLETLQRTTPLIAKQYPRSTLTGGEVLLGIRASIGAAHIAPSWLVGANLSRGVARIVTNETIRSNFLVFYLRTDVTQKYWDLAQQGSTFSEVAISTVKNLSVVNPPLDEQDQICEFVAEASQKIDLLGAQAEKVIALLQERRTALISAAVTGKIDVRGFAPKEASA